jgi:predicted ribosome quality control (RQC) complex YloA/Tae2 family protein
MRVPAEPATPEALLAAGTRIAEQLAVGSQESRVELLRRAIAKAVARVKRRRDAVRDDLGRAAQAERTARGAELFVAEAARAPRGATKLVAVDWSDGSPREIEFPLDPARGAREQLDALFHKARRMKDGARIAEQRLADAEKTLAALGSVAHALEKASAEDLASLEARARSAAPRDFALSRAIPSKKGRAASPEPSLPYRTYLATSGARILVGKGAEKNDALTFHVARPHDLWLHAKGRVGAHVVVPLAKGASCPADVLVEAAHLAAHFSEAKGETAIEIQYTPRRYLRKPKGSAPGFVVIDREKVLVLRRQPALEKQLLEREGGSKDTTG